MSGGEGRGAQATVLMTSGVAKIAVVWTIVRPHRCHARVLGRATKLQPNTTLMQVSMVSAVIFVVASIPINLIVFVTLIAYR